MQLATGWHPPFWTWHSSKSIIYPKWDSVRETAPNGAKRKLTGESTYGGKTNNGTMDVHNEELILTRAVLPVTCKAAETEAGMAANCVDTPRKFTALLLPCLTLVHI